MNASPAAPRFDVLLPRVERAGLFHLPAHTLTMLEEAADELDYPMRRIDLSGVRDKDAFLVAVGRALQFPDWYAPGWDALADCLGDLSWLAADGYVVVLDRADGFAAAAPQDFATALAIFQEAADRWRADGVPFWTLVGLKADQQPWLPDPE